jgi:hypothetical protein
MNKFTAIFIAIFASEASARLTLTGAPVNKLDHPKNGGEAYDARIIIGGLRNQDMSETDLKTIGESAVAAYNDVFSSVGFAIDGLKTQASIPLDSMSWAPTSAFRAGQDTDDSVATYDDAAAPTENSTIVDAEYMCDGPLCPNGQSELILVGVDWYNSPKGDEHHPAVLPNIAQLHTAFEVFFCSQLRTSGSANLVDAKDCSFSFVEKPGNSGVTEKLSPVESAYAVASSAIKETMTEAQIIMTGLLHDFSDADRELINQSILAAHSEAFASTDYSLKSFNMEGDVDFRYFPFDWPRCRICKNNTATDTVVTLITAVAVAAVDHKNDGGLGQPAKCRLCKDDDALATAAAGGASVKKLASMHEAFEKSICTKLNTSGSANFANAHDCSFRFVARPHVASQVVAIAQS